MAENGAIRAEQSQRALAQKGSPESLARDPAAHGLTCDLEIHNGPLPAGTPVSITKKWHELDYFYFEVTCESSGKKAEFLLTWLFEYDSKVFAVLSYPAPIAAELDEPIYIMVQVSGKTKLRTVDHETMHGAAKNCFDEMTRVPRSEPDVVNTIFGEFPSWQDLQKQL